MSLNEYTLKELAMESGVESRTIRSWFKQGLLRGPERTGRGVRYGRYHLDRLKVIRMLRQANARIPLAKIRKLMLALDDRMVRDIANGVVVIGGLIDTDEPDEAPLRFTAHVRSRSSDKVKDLQAESAHTFQDAEFLEPDLTTRFDEVLEGLKDLTGNRRVPESTRGEMWHELQVTPDIRLSVRGMYSSRELARLHRISDYLRELLLGGGDLMEE